MRFFCQLTVVLVALQFSGIVGQSYQQKLIKSFIDANTNVIKGEAQNDPELSEIIAKNLNLTSQSNALQDDSSANLVLMDSTVACDSGWTKSSVNGMCYKISSTDLTWYAAEDWCYAQRDGSHLTSVHSQAEAEWIAATYKQTILFSTFMDNWVGLRRNCDNTTYIWTDGSPVDYLWWQSGYPKSVDPELSCATIWITGLLYLIPSYKPGQLDDIWDCGTNKATPTCKYDPTSTAPHVKYDTSYTCATTTTVSTTTSTTLSTTTVTTTTPTTPTTTTTITTTSTTPTTTTVTTTVPTTPTTPSTTTVTTTVPPTTTTVTVPTVTPATTLVPTTTRTTTALSSDTSSCTSQCEDYWTTYNGQCYAIIRGTATWATAGRGCGVFGGTMATVVDAEMNEFFRMAYSTNNDSTIMNQAWIGASTSYTNWAPGKPDQSFGAGYSYCNVMAMSVVNGGADLGTVARGVWFDYPCNKTQEFVLCQKT